MAVKAKNTCEELRKWFEGLPYADKTICVEQVGGHLPSNIMNAVQDRQYVHEAWIDSRGPEPDPEAFSRITELSEYNLRVMKERYEEYVKRVREAAVSYRPSPANLSGVSLTGFLLDLQEDIAKNAHRRWMEARMKEGGTLEQYPDLMPWEDLSDAQKESALDQAGQTVRLVVSMFGRDAVLDGMVSRDDVVDAVARNAHEVWARQRMDAGWTYAPVRDNEKMHHPMLIPYDLLPESEKAYDRFYGMEFFYSYIKARNDLQADVEGRKTEPQGGLSGRSEKAEQDRKTSFGFRIRI